MKPTLNLNDEDGAAIVEFALILPLFLALLFGIIEFSLLLYNQHVITNACREGARAGIVMRDPRVSDAQIKDVIDKYADKYLVTFGTSSSWIPGDPFIDPPDPFIDPPGVRTGIQPGSPLTVTITFDYDFLVLPKLKFGPIDSKLRAKTIMKME